MDDQAGRRGAPPNQPKPVAEDIALELERVAALLEGRGDHGDLARRFEWLIELLTQRGYLVPAHRRILDRLKATRSTVKLAVFRDKRAIEDAGIDCEARLPLCRAACCRFTVTLSAEDIHERRLRWDIDEPYVLPRDPDSGYCVYCGPGGSCAAYADRPGTCRAYSCRHDARVWEDFERRIPAAGRRDAASGTSAWSHAAAARIQAAPGNPRPPEEPMSLHDLSASAIDGTPTPLRQFAGKVALVVNTASECGYTPQYDGLEKLWESYRDKGLVVLGFPSNDFGAQEPGSETQIQEFCRVRFGVSFPLFAKVRTKGAERSPVYAFLAEGYGEPRWNFHKYLVGKDGRVRAAFPSSVAPESAELRAAIDAALAE